MRKQWQFIIRATSTWCFISNLLITQHRVSVCVWFQFLDEHTHTLWSHQHDEKLINNKYSHMWKLAWVCIGVCAKVKWTNSVVVNHRNVCSERPREREREKEEKIGKKNNNERNAPDDRLLFMKVSNIQGLMMRSSTITLTMRWIFGCAHRHTKTLTSKPCTNLHATSASNNATRWHLLCDCVPTSFQSAWFWCGMSECVCVCKSLGRKISAERNKRHKQWFY